MQKSLTLAKEATAQTSKMAHAVMHLMAHIIYLGDYKADTVITTNFKQVDTAVKL